MLFDLKDPMILFARVKGKNGRVRELSSILDFNSHYCWILRKDAVDIGYPEVINRPEDYESIAMQRTPHVISARGLEQGILAKLSEVSIGDLTARDVDALAFKLDIPLMLPIDIILGRTFLDNFKLTVDPKSRTLELQ
jgi:hypothetical protein